MQINASHATMDKSPIYVVTALFPCVSDKCCYISTGEICSTNNEWVKL